MGLATGFLEIERKERPYEKVESRLKNWHEFVLPLPPADVSKQGARCMDCGIPFCHNGCPVNNLIPDWNELVRRDRWQPALEVLHSTNNFPEFTGRICPAPCEAACTLNIDDNPVTIKSIECSIVDRGWGKPEEMIGSWAGAMGHTQWMPEVWLNMGVDFDRDGRVNPFGKPDDAFAGTAKYLLERGKYRRGEAWGCEAKLPQGFNRHLANNKTWRTYAKWHELGVRRADGTAFARPNDLVKLWLPEVGGPAFLTGQNFRAVYSYNPSSRYSLALVHLGDLVRGDAPFRQQFPGGERAPTLEEVKEIQRRLIEKGFKTDGIDGRTGTDTVRAIAAFQKKVGMDPADGYAGLKVLARLRQPG